MEPELKPFRPKPRTGFIVTDFRNFLLVEKHREEEVPSGTQSLMSKKQSPSATGVGSPLHCVDRLADRELAVLELIGKGRTTREIAATLGVRVPTIDTYRARIKEKMPA